MQWKPIGFNTWLILCSFSVKLSFMYFPRFFSELLHSKYFQNTVIILRKNWAARSRQSCHIMKFINKKACYSCSGEVELTSTIESAAKFVCESIYNVNFKIMCNTLRPSGLTWHISYYTFSHDFNKSIWVTAYLKNSTPAARIILWLFGFPYNRWDTAPKSHYPELR